MTTLPPNVELVPKIAEDPFIKLQQALIDVEDNFRYDFIAQKERQKIPPQTCHLIDDIYKEIKCSIRNIESIIKETEDYSAARNLKDVIHDLKQIDLEEIRKHNETLRNLGRSWFEIAENGLNSIRELI